MCINIQISFVIKPKYNNHLPTIPVISERDKRGEKRELASDKADLEMYLFSGTVSLIKIEVITDLLINVN